MVHGKESLFANMRCSRYRLVYQVRDSPAPRRVVVISFDEHDAAYQKAKMRIKKKK